MRRSSISAVALLIILMLPGSGNLSGQTPNCPGSIKGIQFVPVAGGTYRMGSEGFGADEVPVHEVQVDGFCISVTEITVRQLVSVLGRIPGDRDFINQPRTRQDSLQRARRDSLRQARMDSIRAAGGPDRPRRRPLEKRLHPDAAVSVSWKGAALFCNALSKLAGLEPCYDPLTFECDFSRNGFRLPTEAEWEYACRAGTSTAYCTGDDAESLQDVAWFGQKTENDSTRLVGMKKANALGIKDMHGNVWEWCNDWYRPGYYASSPVDNPVGPEDSGPGELKVNRGGSRSSGPLACRSSTRRGNPPSTRNSTIGFRIVCRTK